MSSTLSLYFTNHPAIDNIPEASTHDYSRISTSSNFRQLAGPLVKLVGNRYLPRKFDFQIRLGSAQVWRGRKTEGNMHFELSPFVSPKAEDGATLPLSPQALLQSITPQCPLLNKSHFSSQKRKTFLARFRRSRILS